MEARMVVGPPPAARNQSRKQAAQGNKNAFEGIVISTSGKIPDYKHDDIQAKIEACGAKFEKLRISDCTHLITTAECYHSKDVPAKITQAQQTPNCKIVSLDWLLESIKEKRPLDSKGFLIRALGGKRLVSTSTTSTSKANLKRKRSADLSHSQLKCKMNGKHRVLAKRDMLSALVDRASHPKDKIKGLAVWINENDEILDATMLEPSSMLQTPTRPPAATIKIIRIQLIADIEGDKYHTYIRETTISRQTPKSLGSTSIRSKVTSKGFGDISSAIRQFEIAFEQRTGLTWSARSTKPKHSKAVFIHLKTQDNQKKLDSAVSNVLSKLVAPENLPTIKAELLKPYPNRLLGREEGLAEHFLPTAIGLLDKISEAQIQAQGGSDADKTLESSLTQCFLELFWQDDVPLPHKITSISETRSHIEDLRNIRAIEDASNKKGKLNAPAFRHIFDLLHLAAMIPVREHTDEYKFLAGYFRQSFFAGPVTILDIFQIERQGEAQQFSRSRKSSEISSSHRRLLWHGSPVSNFPSILRHGLRIGPSDGIFFADLAGKSLSYCCASPGQHAFMLLSEVELGQTSPYTIGYTSAGKVNSYFIDGQSHAKWCDAGCVHPDLKGVQIPDMNSNHDYQRPGKEYITVNPAQVRQRYLFHIKPN
ncbi:uncharacterized protein N7496_004137 [Penicillium cataractarum]|uniref:Poly [ADP-ribose] polymerase n=1 Tax=Penicillium cataractarum TaxID=2100454 RepID=A0A9W9SQM9_9EURO|nr:uncharacterized protein N7496_004137 [Penicillium cataractarum]KAJ5381709.1 hypothetical protein N7496_004137 [Penicillium cataractarum]